MRRQGIQVRSIDGGVWPEREAKSEQEELRHKQQTAVAEMSQLREQLDKLKGNHSLVSTMLLFTAAVPAREADFGKIGFR